MRKKRKTPPSKPTIFQITLYFPNGSRGFIYFETNGNETKEKLIEFSKKAVWREYKRINDLVRNNSFFVVTPPRPQIDVSEYMGIKKVFGGFSFKTKWRENDCNTATKIYNLEQYRVQLDS